MDRLLSEQEVIKAVNKHTIPSVEIILSEDITTILKEVSSAEPKWIPVSEKLPKENTAVLVWCPERKNIYCAFLEEKQWWIFGGYFSKVILEVIAWMPLPERYKEGG